MSGIHTNAPTATKRNEYAKNWAAHIDLRDLLQVFAVRSELGSFLKSQFNVLCICGTKDYYQENKESGWKLPIDSYLWTDDIYVALAFVIAGGGINLRTLLVGEDMYDEERSGLVLVNDFLKHCPNVSSLSIAEKSSFWLNSFGKQLERLELRTANPIEFPLHSTTLRELTLGTYGDGSFSTELWRRIGPSLETLILHHVIPEENEVSDIKEHCRNLKSISIGGGTYEENSALANLLASYGGQLKYAHLYEMSKDQMRTVVDACPNARFLLRMVDIQSFRAALNMIGSRLAVTKTFMFTINHDFDIWKNMWDNCAHLRELDIYLMDMEYVRAIFATKKEKLEVLRLYMLRTTEEVDVKKALDICASGTKCVEQLVYDGPHFSKETSCAFFESNRASLSVISVKRLRDEPAKKLDELLDSFLELPTLEHLHLFCGIPDHKLKALEKRGVYCKLNAIPH